MEEVGRLRERRRQDHRGYHPAQPRPDRASSPALPYSSTSVSGLFGEPFRERTFGVKVSRHRLREPRKSFDFHGRHFVGGIAAQTSTSSIWRTVFPRSARSPLSPVKRNSPSLSLSLSFGVTCLHVSSNSEINFRFFDVLHTYIYTIYSSPVARPFADFSKCNVVGRLYINRCWLCWNAHKRINMNERIVWTEELQVSIVRSFTCFQIVFVETRITINLRERVYFFFK